MRTEAKVFWTLTTLVLLVMILAGATKAAELYTVDYRSWHVCENESVATSIAEMYLEGGTHLAANAWSAATHQDLCFVRTGPMTPIEIVFRADDLNVVKVREDDGTDLYWITFEPIKENAL